MNCCCPLREIRVAGAISAMDATSFRYEIKPTRTGPHPDELLDLRNQNEIKLQERLDEVKRVKLLQLQSQWDLESNSKRIHLLRKKSEKTLLEDTQIAKHLTLQIEYEHLTLIAEIVSRPILEVYCTMKPAQIMHMERKEALRQMLSYDICRYNKDLLAVGKAIYVEPL